MRNLITILIFVSFLVMAACDRQKSPKNDEIVATYEGGQITLSQLDETIKDELFEQLYGVYYLRSIALEEVIAESLLLKESQKSKLSREQFLQKNVYSKLDSAGLNAYKEKYHISRVSDPAIPGKSFPLNSEEGRRRLWESYSQWSLAEYCKDLADKYRVKKRLFPPLSPAVDLDSIDYISIGKKNSPVSVWIMSDFDCPSCQSAYPTFSELYSKYSDKVEFRYTHLSAVAALPAIACECADKVGTFKAVYDYLYSTKSRDSLSIVRVATNKVANPEIFNSCLINANTRRIASINLKRLAERGIDKTPSVFVNGRLFYGQLSEKALSDYIEYCLEK
jgi:protein-disulfide isomerase